MSATLKNTYAPVPNTERGRVTHLGVHPKGTHYAYPAGNSVVIRSISDPMDVDIYQEHPTKTTVAKWAPSGYYVASADIKGNVKVWATQNDHILKHDHRPLSSKILDLAWTADSQRMIAVGEGTDVLAKAFLVDGGTTIGEVSKHEKSINAVDIKSSRPFRAVTCSEDFTANFFEGPPFKMTNTLRDHSNFVNCVRYSPDGTKFVTVSSDRTGVVYDGKEGTKIAILAQDSAHQGSILAVAWSSDNTQIATASMDKTVKVWKVAEGDSYPCVATLSAVTNSNDAADQFVGVSFVGKFVVAVALSGDIFYFDPASGATTPVKTVTGHTGGVNKLAYRAASNTLYSANKLGGQICVWTLGLGPEGAVKNTHHQGGVFDVALSGNGQVLVSCGGDSFVRFTDATTNAMKDAGVELKPQARQIAVNQDGSVVIAVSTEGAVLIQGTTVAATFKLPAAACSVALSPDEKEVAIGAEDNKIYVLTIGNGTLTQRTVLDRHTAHVIALKYSPDGQYLASGCAGRELAIWDITTGALKHQNLKYHNAKICDLAWAPNSQHLATASVDASVIAWDINNITNRVTIPIAHKGGAYTVLFLENDVIATGGDDRCVRTWSLKFQ